MRSFLISFSLFFVSLVCYAQNATNFTVADCDGVVHDLYQEIDAGKVIVICWVMPCTPCVGPAKTSYNIVQSYQASFPNRVVYYLVDDYANTTCGTLNNWANSNGIPASSFSKRFSNSAIDMNDYGSPGMPKVVIVGGDNYSVYYNANNTVNATAMQDAINIALTPTFLESMKSKRNDKVEIFPSPVIDEAQIRLQIPLAEITSIEILNLSGSILKQLDINNLEIDNNILKINTFRLNAGQYFLKVTTTSNVYVVKFIKIV